MTEDPAILRMIDKMPAFMHPEIDRIENWEDLEFQVDTEIGVAEGDGVDPRWTPAKFARAKKYLQAVQTAMKKTKNPAGAQIINRRKVNPGPKKRGPDIAEHVRQAIDYLQKARVADTAGERIQSREYVSLAISKLAFLLDWMNE